MTFFSFGSRGKERKSQAYLPKDYPPFEAPFPRRPIDLTADQAHANLEYLLSHRLQRLSILNEFLTKQGIAISAGLENIAEVKPVLNSIHGWTLQTFPSLFDARLASRDVWLSSSRRNGEIVHSLIMDLAILLGELIVTHRPTFRWALDLDPDNIEMETYKRSVVQIAKGGAVPSSIIIDVEAIVFGHYRSATSPTFGQANYLAVPVLDAISGAYERYWLEAAAKR